LSLEDLVDEGSGDEGEEVGSLGSIFGGGEGEDEGSDERGEEDDEGGEESDEEDDEGGEESDEEDDEGSGEVDEGGGTSSSFILSRSACSSIENGGRGTVTERNADPNPQDSRMPRKNPVIRRTVLLLS
jgi:hypothetical protein